MANQGWGRQLRNVYRHGYILLDEMFGSHWWLLPYGERWRKRISSPAFLSCLFISLLSLESEGKVRKQYEEVVRSSHCESSKTRPLSHIYHDLISFHGHRQWTLLVSLRYSLDPSWTRELNCFPYLKNKTFGFSRRSSTGHKVEWKILRRSFRTGRLSLKIGWITGDLFLNVWLFSFP